MSYHHENCKRVWLIGASSGIGAALAKKLAQAGAEVIVSARRAEKLQELAQWSSKITPLPLDVERAGAIHDAVAELDADGRLPDLTIYSAAIYEPGGMDILSTEAARNHMSVNYLGAVSLLSALFPKLKEKRRGSIAIVSSLSSYCGLPKAALYGPTKAALTSLCETIKPEFDEAGVGLQLINPGFVDTQLTREKWFFNAVSHF